ARAVADRLRRDPAADARVRSRVGELLLRLGARDEALRAFSEIVEGAPYDPAARERLGDLLLAYDWFDEAYAQYVTLRALRPGDPAVEVRVALAALGAGREDEALRTLRAASEGSGDATLALGLRALLEREVLRIAAERRDDPGLRAWTRATRAEGSDAVVLRWSHPDVGLELLGRTADETAFVELGASPLALGLRVHQPLTAVEGTHYLVRARVGVRASRPARATLLLRLAGASGPRAVQADVALDATHRARGYVVRGGALVEEPVAPTDLPPATESLE
ncbi:MAG: putative abductin-like protein, partial [Myxococcaceae bacterium]|nr:putative abductin-like protein [Myxococcaceae bacterium]